jgi:hypothetical protein
LATTNKNFKVKNGLEVAGEIGVGSTPSYGTAGQILSSQGAGNAAAWIDVAPGAAYTSVVKHDVRLAESITKGQAVYVSSSNGSNMVVSKASNASEATSSKTLGLLESSGSTNNQRNVVTEGLLGGIDVGAAVAGDPVWLGTSGNLIYGLTNKPIAPAHLVFIGIVTRDGNNGEIFVRVQNGFELNEIHNVLIGTDYTANSIPGDNEFLAYNLATNLWINQTAEEAGVANLSGATFTGNVAGTNISVSGNVNATTVNATTLIGNTNASTITTGTIDNARTSANSANGASTIVARDASGNFTAGQVTANISTLSIYSAVTNNKIFTSSTGVIGEAGGASYFVGDGSNLTSITLANVTGLSTALDGKANLSGATFTGDIAVNGGDITTNQTTATLYNTTATTVHIGNAANVTLGNIAHSGNVTVNNDLVVYGKIIFNNGASELSATTIQIDDTLISLSDSNPADTSDVGFYAGYKVSTVDYHTGLVRDASDKVWNLFSNVAQPTGTVDFTNAVYDTLKLGNLTAVSNVNAATVNATTLRLTSTAEATSSSTDHALQIGPSDGVNLRIDQNEISRFNNGEAATLLLNPDGGDVIVGQTVSANFTVIGPVTGTSFTGSTIRLTSTDDVNLTSTTHAFQIGADSAENLRLDVNEIEALTNGAASTLNLNANGGTVQIGVQDGANLTVNGNITANIITANNVAINVTALATSGTIDLDFNGAGYRTMANITGTTTFTASNYSAGETVTVRIINGSASTTRTINFPAGWVFVGPEPTNIAPLKTGILTITSFGTTEADCVAAWAVSP